MSDAPLNPFTSRTVSSLRKIEPPIRWLNDAALRKLIAVFEVVEEKPHRCALVQPVISRGDGYGKSHLLGRLIQELDGRATFVPVADYHDPHTCWVTLLQSMLSALSEPELIHHLPYPPTPIDELAHQVLGFLAVMMADKGVTDKPIPDGRRDDILEGVFEKWDLSDSASPLGIWVNQTLSECEQDAAQEGILVRLLKAATLHSYSDDASAMNWLLVLHRYASDRADEESRQMCMEWMLSNQLEVPAEVFLQNEAQLASNNLIARQQALDLLALAKLYRPFLLCFDQTGALTSSLAQSFGNMLMDLVRSEGAHFSIVTANSNLWESTLLPQFDPECISCLATKMELVGLTREQGRSLAEQRLQSNRDPVEFQERFLKKEWLQEQFAQGSLGQGDFLSRCALRYQELVPNAISHSDDAEAPTEPLPVQYPALDSVPTPDFSTAIESVPSSVVEDQTASRATLPPLSEIQIAEQEPDIIESSPETPSASPPVSLEILPISPASESPALTEITDTPGESNAIPVESTLPEPEATDATPEISTTIEEISTPVLMEASAILPEANANIEAPLIPEIPAPTEALPDRFSSLTPLVETLGDNTEENSSFNPPILLPPPPLDADANEAIETPYATDSETLPPLTEEPVVSISDTEIPTTLVTPSAKWPSIFTEEPEDTAPIDTPAEVFPAASQEPVAFSPSDEIGQLEPLSSPEAISEPLIEFSEFSPETPEAIEISPAIEDSTEPFVSEPLIADEVAVESSPLAATPLLTEFEPQVFETASEASPETVDLQPIEAPEMLPDVSTANEPDAAIEDVPTPVADEADSIVPEAEPLAAISVENDQALLCEALLQIIHAHRFASYIAISEELRRKMQRAVTVEEAILCAQTLSEIHIYADGPNAAFLWQGVD